MRRISLDCKLQIKHRTSATNYTKGHMGKLWFIWNLQKLDGPYFLRAYNVVGQNFYNLLIKLCSLTCCEEGCKEV